MAVYILKSQFVIFFFVCVQFQKKVLCLQFAKHVLKSFWEEGKSLKSLF